MAELDIGAHCSVLQCKQLDFLPFKCDGCGFVFCKDHRNREHHQCSQHLDPPDRLAYEGPTGYECSLSGCSGRELTCIICEHCGRNFCLGHRHQVDHRCEKYEAPPARMEKTALHVERLLHDKAQSQTVKDEADAKNRSQGRKSRATAAKVALMKIKMKAVGDKGIPDCERVYLDVHLPALSEHGKPSRNQAMFVSKEWTVGRAVDKMADLAGLRNENNVVGGRKLQLLEQVGGDALPVDQSVSSLMQGDSAVLFSGSSVHLVYVTH